MMLLLFYYQINFLMLSKTKEFKKLYMYMNFLNKCWGCRFLDGKEKIFVSSLYSAKHPQEWPQFDLTRFFTHLEYLIMNIYL